MDESSRIKLTFMDFKVSDKLMREQSFLSDQQRHFFSKFYFLTKLQKMHNYMRKESLKIFRLAGSRTLDLCDTGTAISAIELATQLGDGH